MMTTMMREGVDGGRGMVVREWGRRRMQEAGELVAHPRRRSIQLLYHSYRIINTCTSTSLYVHVYGTNFLSPFVVRNPFVKGHIVESDQ
jgi:hypothetical protein